MGSLLDPTCVPVRVTISKLDFVTPTQIADLLNFVLRSTYFPYNGLSYEQKSKRIMEYCKERKSLEEEDRKQLIRDCVTCLKAECSNQPASLFVPKCQY